MIPFTQYLRPDGRQVPVTIDRPTDVEEKAHAIIAAGYVFEVEELQNGVASFTISDGEDDVAMELVRNGPGVPAAVDKLVTEFEIPKHKPVSERALALLSLCAPHGSVEASEPDQDEINELVEAGMLEFSPAQCLWFLTRLGHATANAEAVTK